MGGLLAGVSLASTPFRDAIAARLAPLRDFLLLFFFIGLGASLDLGGLQESGLPAAVLSLFVLIGNPLIVVAIIVALGYHRRTGFLAGLTVAQISEFSLIFMAMGVSIGHVTTEALGLVTLVGLITIAASTYMITYSHRLYALCEPLLRAFDWRGASVRDVPEARRAGFDVVLFGLGRFGGALGRRLQRQGLSVFGVDINPTTVHRWRDAGYEGAYGDVGDAEFLATLPLSSARWAISTVRDQGPGVNHADGRLVFMQALRNHGFAGRIAVTTTQDADADMLLAHGADLILEPFKDAADRGFELILGIAGDELSPG